jgi:cytochrome c nitrite reductase small subunit
MPSSSQISVLTLIASAMVGVLLGLSGFTFYNAKGTSYLSNDPAACANCHIMRSQFDGWQKASHHQVATCNDCHTPHELIPKYLAKMENGYRHSSAFTLQNFHEPIRITPHNADILQENCIACHENLVDQIAGHDTGAGTETLYCPRCHSDVGHGPTGN